MGDNNPKSEAEAPKTVKIVPKGYISINKAIELFSLSYDQIYWMIRKNYISHVLVKKSKTRPVHYVSQEDVANKLECKNVTAEDYERLRAEKLAVEIRLKRLKEEEYIEEIKSQEDARYIRQTRWIFGDMKSWPDIFKFTDEQREMWNENLDRISEKIEEVS